MDPNQQSERFQTFYDYWVRKLNAYLNAAKEESFDLAARHQEAKFARRHGFRHCRRNRGFAIAKLEKAVLDLCISKLEAEQNVKWAEKMIAEFKLLSQSRVKAGGDLNGFIRRNGIREKLGKAFVEDEFIAMWRAFNANMTL
jgi:hypothetical protein